MEGQKIMALENIRQTILADAKTKATRIVDAAKMNAANYLKLQTEAADQEFDRICRHRMQAIEEEHNRKLIQFKGAAGKQVLDKRNALLRALFEKARKEILTWPSERYARVMGRLLEKTTGSDGGMIRVHPEDVDVFQKVLNELNAGRDAKIALSHDAPLLERGGFIFVCAGFEVDQTLDTMLREIEHEMLPRIAAALFQE
jgi:vacuolar-type H+-ATPase subunit E/Vma4